MTETPGNDLPERHDSTDSNGTSTPGDDRTSASSRPDAWQAPSPAARRPVDDRPDAGAPPLPTETPVPLAQTETQPTTPLPFTGDEHRAPASADHGPYAGAHSAAYASVTNPQGAGSEAGGSTPGQSSSTGYAAPAGLWSAPSAPRPKKRGLGAFVAVAVVAAVIGALVATGGYALLGRNGSTAVAGGGSGSLTVNNYKDATVVTAVAAKATPSVVTISVSSGSSAGTGSGVILSDDGYILTNTHVVTLDGQSGSGTVSVTLSDGTIFPATIVGTDPVVDLAVIKIKATGLKPISFADSSKLNVGDTAVAIGAPLGLSNTVTDGIVSTLNRSITVASSAAPDSSDNSSGSQDNNGQGPFSFDNGSGSTTTPSTTISLPVIQTDAPINPGNSGGALLDSKGELIGINVAIAGTGSSSSSDSQSGSIGVGFSVPANLAKRVSSEIMASGKASHGLLGASVADATSDTSARHTGALIKSISSGGAAEKAGLRAGDVVTQFDGVAITGATDITAQVRTLAGDSTASVTYIRDGATKTTTVTLGTLSS